jgi:lysylphosphatidylglycerol synthetase-like protein (DUF2156 family)
MFDLGKSTADWLGDLRQSEAFEEADLEELESHLKDEIEQLTDHGLSPKEAFWVATSRLGNREELPDEYAKTNAGTVWRRRCLWIVVGTLAYLVLNCIVELLSYAAAVATVSSGFASDVVIFLGPGMDAAFMVSLSVRVLLTCGALGGVYLVLSGDRLGLSSRLREARRSRSRIIVFYVATVALTVLFLTLLQFAATILSTRWLTAHTVVNASGAASAGNVIFSVLFVLFLVSMVFVLSQPRKSKLHAGLER